MRISKSSLPFAGDNDKLVSERDLRGFFLPTDEADDDEEELGERDFPFLTIDLDLERRLFKSGFLFLEFTDECESELLERLLSFRLGALARSRSLACTLVNFFDPSASCPLRETSAGFGEGDTSFFLIGDLDLDFLSDTR